MVASTSSTRTPAMTWSPAASIRGDASRGSAVMTTSSRAPALRSASARPAMGSPEGERTYGARKRDERLITLAVRQVEAELEAMKFDLIDAGLRVQYVPDSSARETCRQWGRTIGRAVAAS